VQISPLADGFGTNAIATARNINLRSIDGVYSWRHFLNFVVEGGDHVSVTSGAASYGIMTLVPIVFQDATINVGGLNDPVWGYLDVTLSAGPGFDASRIDVHRVVFDYDEINGVEFGIFPSGVSAGGAAFPEFGIAVPEPSGLGLLALGAGGLLARRRRAMAA